MDHLIPRAKGGKSNVDNLVAACKPCNQKKGSRLNSRIWVGKLPSNPSAAK